MIIGINHITHIMPSMNHVILGTDHMLVNMTQYESHDYHMFLGINHTTVTCITIPVVPHKLNLVVLVAGLDTVDTDGVSLRALTGEAAIEVVHWVRIVSTDGVKTLSQQNSILQRATVSIYFVT